ncbi:MAG: DUF1810 domain-containing protein [Bacteroidetes bacterium]|nr:DUF1810 domain-containing protein [Bacteroidota bacterium]
MELYYNLDRFIEAQEEDYALAYREVKQGKKMNHWMWYIFPQLAGLGNSSTTKYFAITNAEEAKLYLEHPILGKRLVEICELLLKTPHNSAYSIFGTPDDLKLLSSMTMFEALDSNYKEIFKKVIDKYYNGNRDNRTLQLLNINS